MYQFLCRALLDSGLRFGRLLEHPGIPVRLVDKVYIYIYIYTYVVYVSEFLQLDFRIMLGAQLCRLALVEFADPSVRSSV